MEREAVIDEHDVVGDVSVVDARHVDGLDDVISHSAAQVASADSVKELAFGSAEDGVYFGFGEGIDVLELEYDVPRGAI